MNKIDLIIILLFIITIMISFATLFLYRIDNNLYDYLKRLNNQKDKP